MIINNNCESVFEKLFKIEFYVSEKNGGNSAHELHGTGKRPKEYECELTKKPILSAILVGKTVSLPCESLLSSPFLWIEQFQKNPKKSRKKKHLIQRERELLR